MYALTNSGANLHVAPRFSAPKQTQALRMSVTPKTHVNTTVRAGFAPGRVGIENSNKFESMKTTAYPRSKVLGGVMRPAPTPFLGISHRNVQAMAAKEIRAKEWNNEVIEQSKSKPVIVQFKTTSCGACLKMKKVYNEVSIQYENEPIEYITVDADDGYKEANACKITAIPAYRVFKDGELVQELSFEGGKTAAVKYLGGISEKVLEL